MKNKTVTFDQYAYCDNGDSDKIIDYSVNDALDGWVLVPRMTFKKNAVLHIMQKVYDKLENLHYPESKKLGFVLDITEDLEFDLALRELDNAGHESYNSSLYETLFPDEDNLSGSSLIEEMDCETVNFLERNEGESQSFTDINNIVYNNSPRELAGIFFKPQAKDLLLVGEDLLFDTSVEMPL